MKKPLTKRQQDAIDRRAIRARTILSKLPAAERLKIFREFGDCTCAQLSSTIHKSPGAAIGALAGGILGAIFLGDKK